MNTRTINVMLDPVDQALEVGLKDLWYPVCPSNFLKESPISLRRLGYKIALWRDNTGKVHALEDRCPHRGAPLSLGVILGDRIACPYHGVEVRHDGTVMARPELPDMQIGDLRSLALNDFADLGRQRCKCLDLVGGAPTPCSRGCSQAHRHGRLCDRQPELRKQRQQDECPAHAMAHPLVWHGREL